MEIPAEAPWAGLPLPAVEREYRTAAAEAADPADLHARADALLTQQLNRHFAA